MFADGVKLGVNSLRRVVLQRPGFSFSAHVSSDCDAIMNRRPPLMSPHAPASPRISRKRGNFGTVLAAGDTASEPCLYGHAGWFNRQVQPTGHNMCSSGCRGGGAATA